MYAQRSGETGTWFLKSQQFRSWIHGDHRTLWCPGIAGAGKTVLSSIVINYLRSRFQDPQIGVAWIYFDYQDPTRQNTAELLACLVQQLARKHEIISDELGALYEAYSKDRARPSLADYSNLLQIETRSLDKTYLVIDALDECTEEGGVRQNFISELQRLPPNVQVLITSRPLPVIEKLLHEPIQLEIRAATQDVRNFLDLHIWTEDQLRENIERDPALLEEIQETVAVKAQGM